MSKSTINTKWQFLNTDGSFRLDNPGQFSRLYFPLANDYGMLSNITPKLKGSTKIGQDAFLTLPVSIEDLHSSKVNRNFWIKANGKSELWSTAGVAKNKSSFKEKTSLKAGLLWHELVRENKSLGLKATTLNFIPNENDNVELMLITIENTSKKSTSIECTTAIPIYARSADNLRDHRHVTSLLHRISLDKNGIEVSPTMTFDERGHHINQLTYTVLGFDQSGKAPTKFYPTVEHFIGEGGSFERPKAIFEKTNVKINKARIQGKEAMGAFSFTKQTLRPGAKTSYIVILGVATKKPEIQRWKKKYNSVKKVQNVFEKTKLSWEKKSQQIQFKTNDQVYDNWLIWVGLQPTLRKLFGNSFLPDFDYGRGGRGWRDLWQDCLALLVTNPKETRNMLLHNFGGIRIDGSNATIISSQNYEFVADRNQITRVWMDHGVWPLLTTALYIHETGDIDFLLKKTTYFRDTQQSRSKSKDYSWNQSDGTLLKTKTNKTYQGTLIEHILVQHLVQFFNVGDHNFIKLENADWNDGLDMAPDKGESVAFTAFYAGNLLRIASFLEYLFQVKKVKKLSLAKELSILLDGISKKTKPNYSSTSYKHKVLKKYFDAVQPKISGKTNQVQVLKIIDDLRVKADSIFKSIQSTEWTKTKSGHAFFNGYYDNLGKKVEGDNPKGVRMTLTAQVFSIMSGVATEDQIEKIVKSIKRFLKEPGLGGVKLNTDFKEIQPNLGRAFSFAYGEKENGAFFNHMQVMLANALYSRGFVKDGYEILNNIFQMCIDTKTSRIYPGIPEYFNLEGRGLYHYLTGSASWYFITLLTEVFGIKGHYGDLLIEPKLVKDQFKNSSTISVKVNFADREFLIEFENPKKLEFGQYRIGGAILNNDDIKSDVDASDALLIPKTLISKLSKNKHHVISIKLKEKKKRTPGDQPYTNPILLEKLKAKNATQTNGQKNFKEKRLKTMPNLNKLAFKHL